MGVGASSFAILLAPNRKLGATGVDLEIHAFLELKMDEDPEQVLGRRFAMRPERRMRLVAGIVVASSSWGKPRVELM